MKKLETVGCWREAFGSRQRGADGLSRTFGKPNGSLYRELVMTRRLAALGKSSLLVDAGVWPVKL